MKATSHMRSARVLLVLAAIAMGLTVAPVHAAEVPPPVVQETSLSAGDTWSRVNNAISVDYNRAIDVTASSVVVTDAASLPVAGTVDTPHVFDAQNNRLEVDRSILYILPFTPLTEEDGPYTAVFSARSINQITGTLNTVTTYTFRVDTKTPAAPSLVNGGTPLPRNQFANGVTSNPVPSQLMVLAPSDTAQLTGLARDTLDAQGNEDLASGIAKVTLHFFAVNSVFVNPGGDVTACAPAPVGNPAACRPPSAGALETKKITVTNTCQASLCPTTFSFQATDELGAGYWTVRASTEDLAGNVSGGSDPVAFLVVKA